MICTLRPLQPEMIVSSPMPPNHNDALVRALEREREAILSKTHAAFASYSSYRIRQQSRLNDIDEEDEDEDESDLSDASESVEIEADAVIELDGYTPRYDSNGRLSAFRESVRQRQARLAFLRRQDARSPCGICAAPRK